MTAEAKLAWLAATLRRAGVDALVMGGHAARYYGVGRNTTDFDFVASCQSTDEVRSRIQASKEIDPAREGPSWRPRDFARFEIGVLPDGRAELLEIWLRNHLLADYAELRSRAERGEYGGELVEFISLPDLLRSKETERESDWQDIALLEEIQDARHLANVDAAGGRVRFLSHLRSRRGFASGQTLGLFADDEALHAALHESLFPATRAFLLPLSSGRALPPASPLPLDEAHWNLLAAVPFGSPKHLAYVEVVRLAYKRQAMAADRRDKETRARIG